MRLKIRRKMQYFTPEWGEFCRKHGILFDHVFEIEWPGTIKTFSVGMFDLMGYRSASGNCFEVIAQIAPKQKPTVKAQATTMIPAPDFLKKGLGHMEDRAATYDKEGGERSMDKTVAAFNIITGHSLTEEEGWLMMEILKQVRSMQGNFKADNYEDLAAYAALRGECASRDRGGKS